ncbi:2-dehydropantoate 2-reductase [Marinobacterium sp. YM272]|uniref:2-dehydropantoate 2-reductase n=1 Tax=Marinobacterium sp. YM272 TaxID=3421654 RepID=UPI003D7F191B
MKICVYGAGAIGGLIAARLSQTGKPVSVLARGETLNALQQRGIGLAEGGDTRFYPVQAVDSEAPFAQQLGVQDLIVIAVKQPSLNAVLKQIGPLVNEDTRVLLAMNGVPWWFLDGLADAPADRTLRCVDPDGELRHYLPTRQVIGCVVHVAAATPEPGVTQLNGGDRLIIGEPYGGLDAATRTVAELLQGSGFAVELSNRIQRDIWFKLWGNMTMNPVSALTRATTDAMLDDPLVNLFCCRVMAEAAAIGDAIGCDVDQTVEERNRSTRKLGPFKTSMLQDVEAGRALEYEALVGAVYEIAGKLGRDVPDIAALYGLIRLLDDNARKNN